MSKRIVREEIDRFHDYSLYVTTRTLYMGSAEYSLDSGESGTDGLMAERVIKNLAILESLNAEPITILMNNIGGDFYHGLAIYDAIKACKSHVTIKVFGHAMSMGSIILQAADSRVMAPNAKIMIHYGDWSFAGHAKTGQMLAKEYDKLDTWTERVYLEKIHEKQPGFPLKKLKAMLDHDTFITAKEATELGLADLVLETNENV